MRLSKAGDFMPITFTAEQLSKMSLQEIEQLYNNMQKPTFEQKERALKVMDTGIYDSKGNLIGDRCLEEDDYIE